MKKVILLLLFVPVRLYGQLAADFESGLITGWAQSTPGHWKADTSNALSGRYSLHHVFDNPEAGTDQAGIPITGLEPSLGKVRWSFKLKHGYDPSSLNNWGVFLMSDKDPVSMIPGGAVNGYIIGVNLSGYDDTLRLWKVRNGALSIILNTRINWQNDIGISSAAVLIVERSADGRWSSEVSTGGGNIADTTSIFQPELFNPDWFGIFYRYSSTRDRLLWLDDLSISGTFCKDTLAPEISKCIVRSSNSADLILNEEASAGFFSAGNFSLNVKAERATSIFRIDQFSVRLTFGKSFKNKVENNIIISSLCDRQENCRTDTEVPFIPTFAEAGDVIISEIMADPTPSVSLPQSEYLELFNRSDFPIDMKNWKLSTGELETVIPATILTPHEYRIICQLQDTATWQKYGTVTGVKSFPSLTNTGRLIILTDSTGNMIHGVDYSDKWYNDDLKQQGGWSLEMIDTGYPFFFNGNWSASVSDRGGTPGVANSVQHSNPDISFKGITNVFPGDSSSAEIGFSEPVKNFIGRINCVGINGIQVRNIASADPLFRKFVVMPAEPLARGKIYSISIGGEVSDFAGNRPEVCSFSFGIPQDPLKGDIVFNELLFNPLPGDADWIEFYNGSSRVINGSELSVVSVSESGKNSELAPLSDENRCILPGDFYVISTLKEQVEQRYYSSVAENIFSVSRLPSMPDDQGHLVLINRRLEKIDEVVYNEKMHYSLLSGYEGISLEKIRPSLSGMARGSWHSASETSGWGTPGAPNSVYTSSPPADDRIIFSSDRITPDNDGYEDLLIIDMNLEGKGNVISILIFDETGSFIRKLADNLLAGPGASATWDGTADDGSIVRSGIYIFLITLFDDTGKSERWKKVCAVVR
jgi:hypothetical protein